MPALLASTAAARLGEALAALGGAPAALGGAPAALRPYGPWLGAVLAAAGLAAVVAGARQPRLLGLWGGAIVGALAGFCLAPRVQVYLGLPAGVAAWAGAAVGGAVCGLVPGAFPLAAGALPGALLAADVPLAGSGTYGAIAGALVGASACALAAGAVRAVFAASTGGILVALGLATAFSGHPVAREVGARPFALAAVALVLGIAGAAYQLARGAAAPGPVRAPPAAGGAADGR